MNGHVLRIHTCSHRRRCCLVAAASMVLLAMTTPPASAQYRAASLRSGLRLGSDRVSPSAFGSSWYSFGVSDLPGARPADGSGALGSSIYGRQSVEYRPAGYPAPSQGPFSTGVNFQAGSQRLYDPLTTTRISAAGAVPMGGGYTSTFASVQAGRAEPVRPRGLPEGRLATLVPKVPWEYAEPLAEGEKLMRQGDYAAALAAFEKAGKFGPSQPEVLLSLMHASLALAEGSYDAPAKFLAGTIRAFPYLLLVDVHPRDFLAGSKDYEMIVDRLKAYVDANPKDAAGLFVLAYLRVRDNLVPSARRLLEQAESLIVDRDDDLARGIRVLSNSLGRAKDAEAAAEPVLGQSIALPTAGISLALPADYARQPLTHASQVLVGVQGAGGTETPRIISVVVHALDEGVSLRMALDHIMSAASADASVTGLTQLEEVEVDYQGAVALARLYSCSYMGQRAMLARLCWARDVPNAEDGTSSRILYVLAMGLLESDVEALLPTFSAVARSVSQTELVRPMAALPDAQMIRLELPQMDLSMAQPWTWIGRRTEKGYELVAADWADGGRLDPRIELLMGQAPASRTPRELGTAAMERRREEGRPVDVVSEGPCSLAGRDGYEFLVRRAAGGDEGETRPAMEMARIIRIEDEGESTRIIALVLRSQTDDEQGVRKAMDVLWAGLDLAVP